MKKYKIVTNSDSAKLELQVNKLAEHGWVLTQLSASISLGRRLFVVVIEKER
jgi:hypothetical protein